MYREGLINFIKNELGFLELLGLRFTMDFRQNVLIFLDYAKENKQDF